MTTPISPDVDPVRPQWQKALAPGPACLSIERLAESLGVEEQAHVDGCVRCRTELAMLRSYEAAEPAEGEGAAVAWIAQETKRRLSPVVSAASPRGAWWMPKWAVMAASLAMIVGAGALLWRPASTVDPSVSATTYRAARVEVTSPRGDVTSAPTELRWAAVPGAVEYDVRIAEVDGTVMWRTSTSAPSVALPPEVRSAALPAKTLVWEVVAKDAQRRAIAESGETRFRVAVASRPPGA